MKRWWTLTLLISALTALLTACSGRVEPTPSPTPVQLTPDMYAIHLNEFVKSDLQYEKIVVGKMRDPRPVTDSEKMDEIVRYLKGLPYKPLPRETGARRIGWSTSIQLFVKTENEHKRISFLFTEGKLTYYNDDTDYVFREADNRRLDEIFDSIPPDPNNPWNEKK